MEAVRMVLITLALVFTAILAMALLAHAAAWARRHRIGHLDVVTGRATDSAARNGEAGGRS